MKNQVKNFIELHKRQSELRKEISDLEEEKAEINLKCKQTVDDLFYLLPKTVSNVYVEDGRYGFYLQDHTPLSDLQEIKDLFPDSANASVEIKEVDFEEWALYFTVSL
jgi:topoisomerase IA-like protein